jgi:lipopolysaccharide transport system ATP-binding protein
MKVMISVENLSKQYRLGTVATRSMVHDMNRWWHTLRGKEDPYLKIGEANDRSVKGSSEYVWALRDVSFNVQPSEVPGIIGRNCAGKSTLLKILIRVGTTSTGAIRLAGKAGQSLLIKTPITTKINFPY